MNKEDLSKVNRVEVIDPEELFTKTNYWYYFQIIVVALALICIADTALGNPIINLLTK